MRGLDLLRRAVASITPKFGVALRPRHLAGGGVVQPGGLLVLGDEALGANGLVCRPGSVRRPGAPWRPSIYDDRCRPPPAIYPCARAGSPRTHTRPRRGGDFLILLQVGFAEPSRSPGTLVVSCTAVSPLPLPEERRSVLCGTVPRVAPGGCYPPPRPVEPGPSSVSPWGERGRPTSPFAVPMLAVHRRGPLTCRRTGGGVALRRARSPAVGRLGSPTQRRAVR